MRRNVRSRPTIALMRIIESVERHRSFAQAAGELGVKVPTISVAISTFEKASNRKLIDRTSWAGGVQMTEEGEKLAKALRPLLPPLLKAFDEFRVDSEYPDDSS